MSDTHIVPSNRKISPTVSDTHTVPSNRKISPIVSDTHTVPSNRKISPIVSDTHTVPSNRKISPTVSDTHTVPSNYNISQLHEIYTQYLPPVTQLATMFPTGQVNPLAACIYSSQVCPPPPSPPSTTLTFSISFTQTDRHVQTLSLRNLSPHLSHFFSFSISLPLSSEQRIQMQDSWLMSILIHFLCSP